MMEVFNWLSNSWWKIIWLLHGLAVIVSMASSMVDDHKNHKTRIKLDIETVAVGLFVCPIAIIFFLILGPAGFFPMLI